MKSRKKTQKPTNKAAEDHRTPDIHKTEDIKFG